MKSFDAVTEAMRLAHKENATLREAMRLREAPVPAAATTAWVISVNGTPALVVTDTPRTEAEGIMQKVKDRFYEQFAKAHPGNYAPTLVFALHETPLT